MRTIENIVRENFSVTLYKDNSCVSESKYPAQGSAEYFYVRLILFVAKKHNIK
jgi:hypothetical protein